MFYFCVKHLDKKKNCPDILDYYTFPWLPKCFHPYGKIPSTKGKHPKLRKNTNPQQLIKHTKISHSIVSLVFRKFLYRTYRNGLNRVTQEVWAVLVRYLLLGIRILVHSCTVCGTSKTCLCLENNRSSFFWMSIKSETKDTRP